jgi:hypothetical protein
MVASFLVIQFASFVAITVVSLYIVAKLYSGQR